MSMRRLFPLLLGVVLTAALLTFSPDGAHAATGSIHPGVQTDTAGAQCTANFIFKNASTGVVYIGQAAHCSGTGAATETNGCDSASLPLGTPVTVDGASKPGTLVYNSWLAMQAVGEKDSETCEYNDLALVQLDPADYSKVDPSIPSWGGPTGLRTDTPADGETVYTYGNSSLRLGLTALSPKTGFIVESSPGGWSHTVYTVTPGIPGDSGSAFLDQDGKALGVLSTVAIAPLPASNGVGNLAKELAYAQSHGMSGVSLVTGGAFTG